MVEYQDPKIACIRQARSAHCPAAAARATKSPPRASPPAETWLSWNVQPLLSESYISHKKIYKIVYTLSRLGANTTINGARFCFVFLCP